MIRLVMTCGICPEQYDAFLGDQKVGYLRMRHGTFRVDVPDCMGETIYTAQPNGDGCFDDDERDYYLRFAVDAIERHLNCPSGGPQAPDVDYEVDKSRFYA